jgi:hypothetical protein
MAPGRSPPTQIFILRASQYLGPKLDLNSSMIQPRKALFANVSRETYLVFEAQIERSATLHFIPAARPELIPAGPFL